MNWSQSLYTEVNCASPAKQMAYGHHILMIGSCFSEHIAQRLSRYRYIVLNNPFGIVYNPVSISSSLLRTEQERLYHASELISQDNLFHSPDHHGSFSNSEATITLQKINDSLQQAHPFLRKTDHVIISLGTAYVYRYMATGEIVANCHKIPQSQFHSYRLGVDETVQALSSISDTVGRMAPRATVIWTVSPVRHLRQQLHENQLSKSTLLLAIDEIIKEKPNQLYFPAYEIMMDQLRDYRFYAQDLLHPSEEAIDIIWNIFAQHYLRQEDRMWHPEIERIHRMIEHRPLHPTAESKKEWIAKCLDKITDIERRNPVLKWDIEKHHLQHRLSTDALH